MRLERGARRRGAAETGGRLFGDRRQPLVPAAPGLEYVYTGAKDGEPSRELLTVTHRTRTIAGAQCIARPRQPLPLGPLGERTTDWYSQDGDGNVWYFGEATAELDRKAA